MTTSIAQRSPNQAALHGYLIDHDASFLADDATFTDVTSGMQWTGREAIAAMLEWLYSGVFEAHVEDVRVIADADASAAAAELLFVGRHIGEFAGVPATGRDVRVPMVVIYELSGGRITAARVHFNVAAFQAQVQA
jgi:steroid delta-isomerase-like uncharacterized protein